MSAGLFVSECQSSIASAVSYFHFAKTAFGLRFVLAALAIRQDWLVDGWASFKQDQGQVLRPMLMMRPTAFK